MYLNMKCILFFSFAILVLTSSENDCPSSNWLGFRNKCYLIVENNSYTFQENFVFCQSQNAATVSIHSVEENNFLKTKLTPNKEFWIGIKLTDYPRKTYEWLDGSLYEYSNWKSQQTDKACPRTVIFNGGWYEASNCDYKSRPICKIDFDLPLNKLLLQVKQLSQQLKEERNDSETRLNRIKTLLEDKLTNRSFNLEIEFGNKEGQLNDSIVELITLIRLMNLSVSQNQNHNTLAFASIEQKGTQTRTLVWILGALLLSIFGLFLLAMTTIGKEMQWMKREMKQSNAALLEQSPTNDTHLI